MPTNNETWLAQQVRISIFPKLESFDATLDLWPQVEGLEKEKQTIDSKTGGSVYEGNFNKHKLVLTVNPVKIDLTLTIEAPAHVENGITVADSLGNVDDTLKEFSIIVESWLNSKNIPDVIRVAFGAFLVESVSSRKEAYEKITKYVPIKLDSSKMGDFSLQLNLFAKSKIIKDLDLNRLTKWGVLKLTPSLSTINNPQMIHEYPTINLSHVELDVNTSQENIEPLQKKLLFSLYSELTKLGTDLSEKGITNYVK